ncbi:MAG TPA: thiaminase II, partial [Vicinamibacteria bacterium]
MIRSPRSGFTGELWAAGEPVVRNILVHPFLRGLKDGTLDEKAFRFYVVEDTRYLTEFARVLSILASKAPRDEWIVAFDRDAIASLEAERALHESYFKEFGLSEEEIRSKPPAPTTLAYTNYLLATAYGSSFSEALSAALPCYWIYLEVGKALAREGSPNRLDQRWIDNYGSADYERTVEAVLGIMDESAKEEGTAARSRMIRHFVTTS